MKTCSMCKVEKPFSQFYPRGDRPGFYRSDCKGCCRVRQERWEKNNSKASAEANKFKNVFVKYGLTKDEYLNLWMDQDGNCAICKTHFNGVVGPKSPCVDHDHETGAVRGLLCRHCNFAIGLADESPETLEAMANYLRGTP